MNYNISANIKVAADGTQTVVHQTQKIADNLDAAQKSASKLNQASKGRTGVQSLASPGGGGGRGGSGGGGSGGGGGEDPRSYRGNRGAAGLRGAAGRDFAGLAVAGGNTTGLVAAYATLAANIFALTAAFKALSDAAKAVQLEKGLEQIGAMSGRTLKPIAKDVRELSGFALSTVESMKTVASATAAGFSGDEISRLTKVAKGASTALGRDLSDSMDRLTRGTIKLEPELLDELGIMTRLNDATKRYALENNKTVSSLTQTERRQAFLNAVLAEGEQKFGGIADSVPVSQFDKLAATIKDFGTAGLKLINDVLDPLLGLLISFPVLALLPLATMFKLTFSKLLPDMDSFVDRAAQKVTDFDRTINKARAKQGQNAQKDMGILDKYSDYQKPGSSKIFDRASQIEKNYDLGGGNDMKTLRSLETKTASSLVDLEKKKDAAVGPRKKALQDEINLRTQVLKMVQEEIALEKTLTKFKSTNIALLGQQTALQNQASRAKQFDVDLATSSGFDQLKTVAKSVGGSLKQAFVDWGDTAKKQLDETGNRSTGLNRKLAFIGPLMRTASVGFVGFGAAASMALKGIEASLGTIFLIITVATLAFQAFIAIADFVTGNTGERKAARDDLTATYDTSVKLVKEAQKFRQNNDFASAINAAVNSMIALVDAYEKFESAKAPNLFDQIGSGLSSFSNIFNDTRTETQKLKDDFDGLYYSLDGLFFKFSDEEFDFISGIRNSLEGLGPSVVDKFQKTIKGMVEGGASTQAITKFTKDFALKTKPILDVFTDIGNSAKIMNDTIGKIRTPDIFNVPYKPFADGLVDISKSLKLIDTAYKSAGFDTSEAKAGIADKLLGSPDALAELGRLSGKTKLIKSTQDGILKTQLAISALEKIKSDRDLTGQEVIQLDNLNKQLTTQKGTIADIVDDNLVLKVQTEAYAEILGQANLKLAQMRQTYGDLAANALKQTNSIAKMNRDIKNLNKYNTTDLGKTYSDIEGVRNAKEMYDIAVSTAKIKKEVIRQEAALIKAQTTLQLALQKEKIGEKFGINMDAVDMSAAIKNQQIISNMTPEVRNIYNLMTEVDRSMRSLLTVTDDVTVARQAAVDLEVKAAKTTYNLAVAQTGANMRQEVSLEYQIGQQKTLLDLERQRRDLNAELAGIILDNDKARAERAARVQGKDGLSRQQQIDFDRADMRRSIEAQKNSITNIGESKSEAAKSFGVMGFTRIKNYREEKASINNETYINDQDRLNALKLLEAKYTKLNADAGILFIETMKKFGLETEAAKAALKGLEDALSGTMDAVDEMAAKFKNKLAETKRTGKLGSDPVGSLLSGMGFSFGSNLVSAREQIVGEFGTGMFEGPEGEQKLQRMALALAEQTTQANLLNDAMQQVGASAAQAFSIMISSPKDAQQAFRDFITSTLSMIAQLLIQMAIMAALKAIIDPAGTAAAAAAAPAAVATAFEAGAAVSQMLSKGVNIMPIGLAAGGVMGRSKGVQGVVSSPTYLVGEGKYNEAVVPLPNGRDIPVQLHGTNSGTNNVSVNVNMANGSSNTQMSGNDGANLGAAIARAVQKELLAQKAPGGILNQYGVA